jgi:quercetin 2,3-dioxygenase
MTNPERDPDEMALAPGDTACGVEVLTPREVPLGGPRAMTVRRTLPQRERSLIGAWCFVDHYGPDRVADSGGMKVAPHPHTGLQTVSWLFTGEIEHRDSAGHHAMVRPGEVNLMTAGRGISHSEVSTPGTTELHGAQLWVALPDAHRETAPAFDHHPTLPGWTSDGVTATVLMGSFGGAVSPGTAYSPLVGVDLDLAAGADVEVPLEPDFEYGLLGASGTASAEGVPLDRGAMLYLGTGRSTLRLSAADAGRVLLLGGEPFDEHLVMWWNFVGRSGEEIADYAQQWNGESDRFGAVIGYDGARLEAPPLPPLPLKPRGRER